MLSEIVNLKRFCKKISDGTLVTHFVCTGFRNLATIKQKSDAYEKGIVYFIFVLGFFLVLQMPSLSLVIRR